LKFFWNRPSSIKNQDEHRVPIIRPSWDDYYLGLAFVIKERSADGETKHGCCLVSSDNIPLSIGYNSFPRGMLDSELPNLRPYKYPIIIHSEANALANCLIAPRLLPSGAAKAYITGMPCFECSKLLYQNGISTFYIADRAGYHNGGEDENKVLQLLQEQCGVRVYWMSKVDDQGKGRLNWLRDLVDDLEKIGYVSKKG
jgi:dCMP deaminase